MTRALWLVGLLLVPLAGCAASSQSDSSSTSSPPEFEDAQATADTGVIRGIVVTASITPIVGATVKLNALNITRTTTESGAFVFNGLKPGTYFVTASKLGFDSIQASTEVKAADDAPPVMRIQLTEDSVNRPFGEMLSWKGFIVCAATVGAAGAGAGGQVCGIPPPPASLGQDFIHEFPFSAGIPTMSQSEMTWDGTQTLGNYMQLGYYLGGTTDWKARGGESPIILNTTHDEIAAKAPKKDNSTGLTARVFPAYPFQAGQAAGVVLITNQDFKVYTTHFYHFTPRAGWTFIKDGECLKPEQCIT
ncbi:MAG TPA: carboxypeptidase-like regulatory domain-containing protein [Candidatus Thermoplasmatota archaeon]|nr:carboxypeptidase-like regulatory domain-containing protein [Candidatus Thermoplasmatota archaeon]